MNRPRAGRSASLRLRLLDLAREALDGLRGRPAATLASVAVAALAVLGLLSADLIGRAAAAQVDARLEVLRARSLSVVSTEVPFTSTEADDDRLAQLPFVRAGGLLWRLPVGEVAAGSQRLEEVPVLAASAGGLEAMGPTLAAGRGFDAGHVERGDPVIVLGRGLADQLGMSARPGSVIHVGGVPFTVLGIASDVRTSSETLLGGVIPNTAADRWWSPSPEEPPQVLVEVAPGSSVHAQASLPVLLRPTAPSSLSVLAPLEPGALIADVNRQLQVLLLAVAAALAVVGVIIVTTQLSTSVRQRQAEIGLRSALGARRRDITRQLLLEGATLATAGATLGVLLALAFATVLAAWRSTAFVFPVWAPGLAPAGAVLGIIAAWAPARRAARIDPIHALRSE